MDVDQIIHEVLTQTGTALYALVGTRVDYARTAKDFSNTEARLVFRPEGGTGIGGGSGVEEVGILFECWGGDSGPNDWRGAKAVYDALHTLWHDARDVSVDGGVLMHGYLEQRGVPVVHPKTKKNYMVARFGGRFRGA